jgi:hypothetical protein
MAGYRVNIFAWGAREKRLIARGAAAGSAASAFDQGISHCVD